MNPDLYQWSLARPVCVVFILATIKDKIGRKLGRRRIRREKE